MKLARWKTEGEAARWYEAHCYDDYISRRTRVAVVPLHLAIVMWHALADRWARLRGQRSIIDRQAQARALRMLGQNPENH